MMKLDKITCMNDYYDGIIEGLRRYAYWKDGKEYVGSCGTTLAGARQEVENERQKSLTQLYKEGE